MDTLITAILIIGGALGVAVLFGTLSEKLKESTGRDLGEWFWTFVGTGLLLAIGYGGYRLIRWGMNDDIVGLVIAGILVMVLAGFFIWATWFDNG